LEFLQSVEKCFAVHWPEPFRTFCRANADADLRAICPSLKGHFLVDLAEFEGTNQLVADGSWGDYERAITGRRRPWDGRTLALDVLPFYVVGKDVLGFAADQPNSDKVVLWSVHTIVHDWPSFAAWLSEEGGSATRSKKPRR